MKLVKAELKKSEKLKSLSPRAGDMVIISYAEGKWQTEFLLILNEEKQKVFNIVNNKIEPCIDIDLWQSSETLQITLFKVINE